MRQYRCSETVDLEQLIEIKQKESAMYDDKLVEQLIMDLGSNIVELENAWRNNHEAVKKEIITLRDSQRSLNYVVSKILAGAA